MSTLCATALILEAVLGPCANLLRLCFKHSSSKSSDWKWSKSVFRQSVHNARTGTHGAVAAKRN